MPEPTTVTPSADQTKRRDPATQAILEADARHNTGLWQLDVVFERGEGSRIYDTDGREYLDCMAGIAVASLGHGHPRLAAAIAEQAKKLIVGPQNTGSAARTSFVTKLFELVKPPLERVFLSSSGAEANEAALKWARVATGRHKFVAMAHGFSGRSLGVLPLTWEPSYRTPFAPLGMEVEFVEAGDEAALASAVTDETAAVLMEPVQGESGIWPLPDSYLRFAREVTSARGSLLIFDEIQSGVGRTGTFLASESSGVSADIVTLAKGLAGGVPIGATLMTDAVARSMPKGGHGSTFGGNPLAAAAGLAVLTELADHGVMSTVAERGKRLADGLLRAGGGAITEVRGRGLMLGAQLTGPTGPAGAALRDAGVLTVAAGNDTLRFLPPLVITEAEVDEVVERAAKAFASL